LNRRSTAVAALADEPSVSTVAFDQMRGCVLGPVVWIDETEGRRVVPYQGFGGRRSAAFAQACYRTFFAHFAEADVSQAGDELNALASPIVVIP
jgi:hypothetical protein